MRRASLCLVFLAACSRGHKTDAAAGSASGAATALAASATPTATDAPSEPAILDFERDFDACTMTHRGVLLDLADRTMRARSSGGKLVAPEIELREREGGSWAAIRSRTLTLSFVSTTEVEGGAGVIVEMRARGGLAKSASVYLNGKPLGPIKLTKGETAVASVHLPTASVVRGENELLLHFNGGPRSAEDALAEIDWIRVGPNDGDAPYSAPTRRDALTTATIQGVPRRGVSLRAPGSTRCTGFLPSGAVFTGFVGASGGEGDAEVRVIVDRSESRVIGTFHVGGRADPQGWRPISLPIGEVGTVAAIELVARSSSKGARIVFARPRVVPPAPASRPPPAAKSPPSRGVVLVVLGTLSRKQISLYGGAIQTPELTRFAERGAIFEAHRGTSTLASSAVASMLTGARARRHGILASDATLSPSVFTVAEAARQAGVVTAMFTANPTTTEPYGFGRGFETFAAKMPQDQDPAVSIFDDVARWLDGHRDDRFFVVVHARGGHPPWDVTSEEVKEMPPANYTGSLEPGHAGEGLSKARHAGARTLGDSDRERAFALHAATVRAHDAALGRLLTHLKTIGRDGDTTIIVTADVGVDAGAHVPFLEDELLDEDALAVPLVVVAPRRKVAHRVEIATSGIDVAPTVLDALALPPPKELGGAPLVAIASGAGETSERPLFATAGSRFSLRWTGFALVGAKERELRLCNLLLDPDCVSDVRATHPLAAEALHAIAFDALTEDAKQAPTPRVAPDPHTANALKAWGRDVPGAD